jgi:hypothetical protein
MDIMNNMTVSTSKLTFSLIAVFALFISGSAMLTQDAYAIDAPEFTCIHINTTATHCTFDMSVNGTLAIADWGIRMIETDATNGGSFTCNEHCEDGDITYDYAISAISNATTAGIGQTTASAGDIKVSSQGGNVAALVTGSGFLNGTDFVLIHATIPTGAEYYINYTNNPSSTNNQTAIGGQGSGAFYALGVASPSVTQGEGTSTNKMLKIGSNATAKDWMEPTAVSAEIVKSNANQVRVLMSEPIYNVNSTVAHFNFTADSRGNTPVIDSITAGNGTNYLYIHLKSAVNISDLITLQYTTADAVNGLNVIDSWITDAVDTTRYVNSGADDSAEYILSGHGNKLLNFTLTVTNWLQVGQYGDVTTCYDCNAPTVTKVEVSLDSSTPITVNDDNKVHINAGIDDTVSVMVTFADNLGADTIPFAGLYTNFGNTPDNLYYSNNFDSAKQMSTSYYEWNVRGDDVAFDNNGAITWTDATAKVNADRTQTFTYTMTINDAIESSQVWVDVGDKVGNYAKIALPITLEVSGAPGLTFASDDTQKVVSFFNESILLAIVSQWTATSSDDASNVEQLSSVLGIESQLPTWTTDLASWVADDKIDVADMIVAVEYVINQ